MEHIYDTVIIGGGPAGYTAALYAARAELDVVLIERLSPGGQMALTDIIDNYPGFPEGIDGITLGFKMQQGAERFGSATVYADVASVELLDSIKKINTTNGTYYAKTVIIASGANPRELGIDGEQSLVGRGVHYCAHCDGRFYKDKTVVVVGGGNSAVSDALYLSKLAKKVLLVHRRDSLRADKIYHKPLLGAENVEFKWDSTVIDFLVDGRVQGVRLKNLKTETEEEFFCDGVFISIGRKPATEFLSGVNIDKTGYIIADETTKTNIPGVFAAGDVRQKKLRQAVTAVSDGAVAAHLVGEFLDANAQ